MFTLEHCKKILGDKAVGLSDETIEQIRDALYVQAGLIFDEWRKGHCLTKGDACPSPSVSQRLTSTQLHAGDSADVN